MKIHVNPNTEAAGFGYAEAGRYRLRIVKVEEKTGQAAPYLNWELEFVDPNIQTTTGKGKVGHIFAITTLKEDAQFRLRQLTDALGLEWGDLDTDTLVGKELDAQVGVEEYEGNFKNVVKKYIPA